MLRQYGPDVPEASLKKLVSAFSELRQMADEGLIAYPYSTREVVNIVKHLQVSFSVTCSPCQIQCKCKYLLHPEMHIKGEKLQSLTVSIARLEEVMKIKSECIGWNHCVPTA